MMLKTGWEGAYFCHLVAAVLVSLALVGCVGGGGQMVKSDYRFKEKERKALGVFSVEVIDQCGKAVPIIYYRPAGTSADESNEIKLDAKSKGSVAGFPQGWFFVQEEEPGDFIFSHVSYGRDARGTISRSPVTFTNGRVTYLGALKISIPNCGQVQVTVADKSSRDLPIFDKYMKYFKSKYVTTQVIQGR